jgi:surfactin synthase thioesterase subunit
MTVGGTIVRPQLGGRPAVRLYLLHHAGGSRAAFRGWPRLFPADWEVVLVDAPGRGSGNPRPTLNDFVESVLAGIPSDGVPYAVFGHSMGALAGFALALAAEAADRESPVWLGVSAHPGPHVAGQPAVQLHRLSAERLREAMVGLGGTAAEVLVDDRIWSWLEPVVRRDLTMAETWLPSAAAPVVRVPLTAYCGQDDKVASPATVTVWASHTERFRGVKVFPGGHFYLQPARERVAGAIAADVLAALSELKGAYS